MDKVSAAAKKRLSAAERQLITDYRGDHAELLSRYFATFNRVESEVLDKKRAINEST